jgi:hypothetical protein
MQTRLLILLAVLVGGCAKYEYVLVQGAASSPLTIGYEREVRVEVEPLQYRMISYENHLILMVYNPTGEVIELIGPRSAAVDPEGQAHPLPSQSIPPSSFVKLILPPVRPVYYQPGPTFGFGVGVVGEAKETEVSPKYLATDAYDVFFWEWKDEGDVRLTLSYQRGNKGFSDVLVFHRRKVK